MEDQSLDQEIELSESLRDVIKQYSIEELCDINRDLDQKIALSKESKQLIETAIDETQSEIEMVKQQREASTAQIAEFHKRINDLKQSLKTAKEEKATAEQAARQRADNQKNSTMTAEEKIELRDKLVSQRNQIDDFEDKIEQLELQKAQYQKEHADFRAALKERQNIFDALVVSHDEVSERRDYLLQSHGELKRVVDALRETVASLEENLKNPVESKLSVGKTLFDEVISEKKALEAELVTLIEVTNSLRQQIRQKQDDIDELESHENENMCIVDTEYVLSKMRQLVNDESKICDVMKTIEQEVYSMINQIEQVLKKPRGDDKSAVVDLGQQYSSLRDYGFDCVKVVSRECAEGVVKLKELFNQLEQLSIDYSELQDRIAQSK